MARKTVGFKGLRIITVLCDGGDWSLFTEFKTTGTDRYEVRRYKNGKWTQKTPIRVNRKLTWREVAEHVGRRRWTQFWGDSECDVKILGVDPWQGEMIIAGMMIEADWDPDAIGKFLRGLPDCELIALHEQYSPLSNQFIEDLEWVIESLDSETGKVRSLSSLRQIAGVPADAGLQELSDALEERTDRKRSETIDKFLREIETSSEKPDHTALTRIGWNFPRLNLAQRTALLALFLRCTPKPVGLAFMTECHEASYLSWLLEKEATAVFQALRDSHFALLQQYTVTFLKETRNHVEFFMKPMLSGAEYTFGPGYHAQWARVARDLDAAGRAIGLDIPANLAFPPISFLRELGS